MHCQRTSEVAMTVRVGINGFGRVGRCFLRAAYENAADIEVVAVNDVADAPTIAHLLRYDSVFGRFPRDVASKDGAIEIDGHQVRTVVEPDLRRLHWEEL